MGKYIKHKKIVILLLVMITKEKYCFFSKNQSMNLHFVMLSHIQWKNKVITY